jgi:hypothetical protein
MAHNRTQLPIRPDVRFGSIADICSAKRHVRFAPDSDRESVFPQKVMSALPPKTEMCSATRDVRFGPIADIGRAYSITSSARASNEAGIGIPVALAVLRFITNSNFAGCWTGRSDGLVPLRMRFT